MMSTSMLTVDLAKEAAAIYLVVCLVSYQWLRTQFAFSLVAMLTHFWLITEAALLHNI